MTNYQEQLWTVAQDLVDRGVDFAWGGGGVSGPSLGQHDGGAADSHHDYEKVGFDAGSLTQYMLFQVFGETIPRSTHAQLAAGVEVYDPEPGDLIFPDSEGGEYTMVYLGDARVVEVTRSGEKVRISEPHIHGAYSVRRLIS